MYFSVMSLRTGRYWLERITSPDRKVGHEARLILGSLTAKDAHMLPDLIDGLSHADEKMRFWALTGICCLEWSAAAAFEPVVGLLSDPASAVRQMAVYALPKLCGSDTDARRLVDLLGTILRTDTNAFIRAEAARSLGDMDERIGAGLEALIDAINHDSDESVCEYAAISLKMLGKHAAPVLTQMKKAAATHPSEKVRSQLEIAIQRLE
jgi:hypothetical protein